MNACSVLTLDIGKCIGGWFAGWMPDWLVPLLPYWWIAALIVGAGVAWKLAGVPGIAAFAAAVGFILGRRSVKSEEIYPHPDTPPAPKPRRKTLF